MAHMYTGQLTFNERISLHHMKVLLVFVLVLLCLGAGCSRKQVSASRDNRSLGYAANEPATPKQASIVSMAHSNLGVQYKLGGNRPESGFDCSGFVRWTYNQCGIQLPRTAKEQMQSGKAIRRENLRPGDLVAFKIRRRGYHTGIYTGNGMFIHSPSKGKSVEVESLASTYWNKRFVTGRRVLEK